MRNALAAIAHARIGLILTALVWIGSVGRLLGEASPDDPGVEARSFLSAGDTARLQRVLAKARRGEGVTIGVIGGSITQGASASKPENRYGNRVVAWWRKNFPKAGVDLVNAGIGATGSNYGALRADRDLLSRHPDLVIVEYAVNDPNDRAAAETLEGLMRQILKGTNHPALLLLFTMNQSGANAQEWHAKVGTHYGVPMISYRDALWPEIQANRLAWADISPDAVHPNDRGHAYCAQFITRLLEREHQGLPTDDRLPEVKPLPTPLFTDAYEWVALLEAKELKPIANQGWVYDSQSQSWRTDQPGSVVEFDLEGRNLSTMHYVVRGGMGRAQVSVDGKVVKELEGWFDQTWGGYRQSNGIAHGLALGKHRVRLELLAEKASQSTGTEFRLLGLGAAGKK